MLALQIAIFFGASGGIIGLRPGIFFAASFLHYAVSMVAQYRLNPALLAHRLKLKRAGSKRWDEVLVRASNLTVLIAVPTVAGLDLSKAVWPTLGVPFVAVGFGCFTASTVLLNWAMAVNPHFEPTVRIQMDRAHAVISTGPYRIVRHPGYLAGILFALSIPLIIGSSLTFIPVGVYTVLFIVRTSLEDRTLQDELNGYAEYARHVRYKLIPVLW